jgi:predicted secreted protein
VKWTSILAIYFLFWVLCAFVLLPFGIRTHEELGVDKTPGQADSAPGNFRPGRLALRATVAAAVMTGLFALNYSYGWLTKEQFDWLGMSQRIPDDAG